MLKKVMIVLAICIIYAVSSPLSSSAINPAVGDEAPDFRLEDLNTGKKVALSDFRGKAVLLTFWATWCPRCWEELDYVKARFSEDKGIQVLLVNMETQSSSPAHVKRIMAKAKAHKVKFPMLLDKKLKVWDSYGVNSLPTTIIVDPEGKIILAEPNFYFASRDMIEEAIKDFTTVKIK